MTNSDILAKQFLDYAKGLNAHIDLIKVLKSRTYSIGDANVLIRAASEGNRRYFFGLNYIHVEEMANIDNPFIRAEGFNTPPFRAIKKVLNPDCDSL